MPAPKKGNRRRSRSPTRAKPTQKQREQAVRLKEEQSLKEEQGSRPSKHAHQLPLELQQLVLDVFKNSFSERIASDLKTLLQEIKGHLYNRDFLRAFGRDDYLEAYAIRWSPSRALAYLHIFHEILPGILEPGQNLRVACLGGGAGAELVALGGYLKALKTLKTVRDAGDVTEQKASDDPANSGPNQPDAIDHPDANIAISFVDIASWSCVLAALQTTMLLPPPISPYAAAHIKAANSPLISTASLQYTFHQQDMLSADATWLSQSVQDAHLTTIFFTLNELFSTSIASTKAFLLSLADAIQPGAYLLVVDSAGSYATVALNGSERQYPMQWLLDLTLGVSDATEADAGQDVKHRKWEKMRHEPSRWFRVPEPLKYPLELENMRYQLHLYRRLDDTSSA
jgi:25S rRNA (uracil2843-N3)-methyltransferase